MATEVVSTIRSSGGDYSSLSAWEAGEQRDLVSADEIAVAECYNDWPAGYPGAVLISGWTTDSTRYVRVTVADGHRHAGVPRTGFYILRTDWDSSPFHVNQPYTEIEWIDLENTARRGFYLEGYLAKIRNCIGKQSPSAAGYTAYWIRQSCTIENCLAHDSYVGFNNYSYTDCDLSNSIAKGCVYGYSIGSSAGHYVTIKNSIAYNNTTNYTGQFGAASTNNAASDGATNTPPGSSPYTSDVVSADFVDAANDDFHLSSGSGLRGQGANLYSSFTTDIDGDTWPSSGAWDIGFDYFTGGAGAAYDETATVSGAVTVTATEAYTAPAYNETASVTATATVEANEIFGAGAYSETATIAATATASATEAYTAPAYGETASVTATATVEASETFGAGAYDETASVTATATVAATEAYIAPAYDETASVTATATVTASEVFTEPGGAFDETADISATATVSAAESYTGPAYSETASITFAALVAASEIYVGPGAGETASITGTVTVDASETWGPPHYSETASIIGLLTVTAVHTFSTPSALPAGISRLSAERVGGFFAERIGRA